MPAEKENTRSNTEVHETFQAQLRERASERFLILTTMKNEAPFMLEWLSHHMALGFTDFVIHTNDCSDGTDMMAKRLHRLGYIHHIPQNVRPGKSPQWRALRRFMSHPLMKEVDWIICMDVDEFINIRAGNGRLADLFKVIGNVDAVSFTWKLFGNNGKVRFQDERVTQQFTMCCPERRYPSLFSRGFKTLFRNNGKFKTMAVHRPRIDENAPMPKWVDSGGEPLPEYYKSNGWGAHDQFSHRFARLHHYAVRSIDSFLIKRDRGKSGHTTESYELSYWKDMNFNVEHDSSINKYSSETEQILQTLTSDVRLKRLHRKAVRWHRRRIKELRQNPEWSEFASALQNLE